MWKIKKIRLWSGGAGKLQVLRICPQRISLYKTKETFLKRNSDTCGNKEKHKVSCFLHPGGLSHLAATDTEVLRKMKRTLNKNKIKTNVTTHFLDSGTQSTQSPSNFFKLLRPLRNVAMNTLFLKLRHQQIRWEIYKNYISMDVYLEIIHVHITSCHYLKQWW